ncbi:MAG: hypothetical protein FJX67_13245 [Alphaproteobacteria bacterium]|nr:hypothetical protein [Alphaproteobacteria bacterium]
MTRKRYWVVGGRYASTDFATVVAGTTEERYGPFETYADARREWQAHAWRTVDTCIACYRIVEEPAPGQNAA